jgi:2-oxo-3-hexenedioate decarboxylase
MQVDEPCYGVLFGSGVLPSDEQVPLGELIHPRVEPEIVLRMGRGLQGPGVTTAGVLAAVDAVGCGLEVIDSRFAAYAFALPDVVADNTSAARIVLGPRWVPPSAVPDLSLLGCVLEVDGIPVATAAGAAVVGHPAAAVAMLANWLGSRGRSVEAGWLVFTGGLTDAVPLAPHQTVTATFGRVGSVIARAA